ncbi:DUF3291 domain-containing protein [Nonomuraea endophytica]|uniref:DUF3291 domain-containing protein n=1 Tax=Nonomuraea endophytica TaxID=714136 RepID=A0A7W7ZWH8_9ACTN|nr:DUF3291 domain-containing protein [Nonomuraea endophytica]MBB5075046.1 hypothetical protein [Nonomuraea endophytica]
MITPWVPGPAAGHVGDVQVMASRFELKSLAQVPGFLFQAMRMLLQARRSAGAVGATLKAAPFKKTFWTLSAWTDRAALGAFAGAQPHRGIVQAYKNSMAASTFEFWTAAAPAGWDEAHERLKDGVAG